MGERKGSWEKARAEDMLAQIKRKTWAGHAMRTTSNRWTVLLTKWLTMGHKGNGKDHWLSGGMIQENSAQIGKPRINVAGNSKKRPRPAGEGSIR